MNLYCATLNIFISLITYSTNILFELFIDSISVFILAFSVFLVFQLLTIPNLLNSFEIFVIYQGFFVVD